MGFSSKDGGLESEGKKWVIAGISLRAPLRSIRTKEKQGFEEDATDDESSTTPTAKESRIPEIPPCPPAPRKPRPSATCHHGGRGREYFTPPDLDSVFKCYVERAN